MTYREAVRQLDRSIKSTADAVMAKELEAQEAIRRLQLAAKVLRTGKAS